MSKKPFAQSTVGKLLFGAAAVVNPTLANVLKGVTSPKDAIAEIGKAKIPTQDKIQLQQMLFEQQAKEMQEITARWISDNKGSWLSRNVRPFVLLFLIVSTVLMIFIDAGVVSFEVKDSWVDLLQLTLITVISAYFGGRSFEKIKK